LLQFYDFPDIFSDNPEKTVEQNHISLNLNATGVPGYRKIKEKETNREETLKYKKNR